jgi:hypothetical protein
MREFSPKVFKRNSQLALEHKAANSDDTSSSDGDNSRKISLGPEQLSELDEVQLGLLPSEQFSEVSYGSMFSFCSLCLCSLLGGTLDN